MNGRDAPGKPAEAPRRIPSGERVEEFYEGVDLAPTTLESLVTWDVSVHARREQERLKSAAYRTARPTHGG